MTVGELKVGAKLVMGKYGVHCDDPYPIVWLKGNPNCDFITEKAVDYLPFDAPERLQTRYGWAGNTDYTMSNLFSFLNSDQAIWYYPMHDNDTPPGNIFGYQYARYEEHYGFLYFFEDYEIASLTNKEYAVNEQQVSSLIRLASERDVVGFELFKRKGVRPKPTEDLFRIKARYAKLNSEQSFLSFWLLDGATEVRAGALGRSGQLGKLMPSDCAGVRPVCTLKAEVVVEQYGDGVFFIKPVSNQNVFTDEELFELLGMAQP